MDLGTDPFVIGRKDTGSLEAWRVEIRFVETIGGCGHRRIGAIGDSIEGNRGTRFDHLNWIYDLLDPTDDNISATAETDVGVVDIV